MRATATPDQVRKFRLRPGDTLITKDSETPEDIAIATFIEASEPDMVCGYHLALLRPRPEFVPKYLHWAIVSDRSRGQFSVAANGMTRYGLTHDAIQSVAVPHLPMEEQRRIAAFLDDQTTRIDQIITARQQQVRLIEALRVSWVSDSYSRLAEEFGEADLRHGVSAIRQGWSPQCDDAPPREGEWGVLRAGCVNGGVFRPDDLKTLPGGTPPRLEHRVFDGDLIVNRASGSLDLIGSCAVAHSVKPRTLLSDKLYRVTVNGRWDGDFVAAMWRSRQIREHLRIGVSGAEGMANSLPSPLIRDSRLPNAPQPDQAKWLTEYVEHEDGLRRTAQAMGGSIALIQEFKRSLISAAVSGEFDVSSASGRGVPV